MANKTLIKTTIKHNNLKDNTCQGKVLASTRSLRNVKTTTDIGVLTNKINIQKLIFLILGSM